MTKAYYISYLFLLLLFSACHSTPKRMYIDTDYTSGSADDGSDELSVTTWGNEKEVAVPFTEVGGVKSVSVKLNGIGLEMLFDTGCSSTLISIAEANYMYQKGLLTDEEILGNVQTMIADGSVVNDALINLKELVIDDKIICRNVRATVSQNASAPLLLGNEVLDRAASYTIDNENKVIVFKWSTASCLRTWGEMEQLDTTSQKLPPVNYGIANDEYKYFELQKQQKSQSYND